MVMPQRQFIAGGYRYGFNGKENDNDVKGTANQQDYGMRIYDPRLGRFLSVDPLTKSYPWLSTYQFAANSPISGTDLDGGEYRYYMINLIQQNGKVVMVRPEAWRVEYAKKFVIETIMGPVEVKVPRTQETFVAHVGAYSYKFASYELMQKAVNVLKQPEIQQASKECNCLPGVDLANTEEAEEATGRFLQGIGNSAAAGVALGDGFKNISGLRLPQGISKSLFKEVSKRIKSATGGVSDVIVVQGSRASGTASSSSDLDIAVKVDAEKFKNMVQKAFGTPAEGTAKWRTMQHAIETGKIQSGEAGLRSLRKELEKMLGMEVDVSVILKGGKFDNGVQIPIK
jgi:RHS repeat-associated protein